jgi:DNA-binding CsgD family transcriptional regulator
MQYLFQDTWPAFFENFSFHHSDFVQNLSRNYPNLSQMEFKICCYLRAGYTNRYIVSLTGRSLRAVETARYRLRKKLSIQSHENLTIFLMKI